MASNKPNYNRWCEGLISSGLRQLCPVEVEQLRQMTRITLFKLWIPITLVIASPLALLASYLLHGNGAEPPPILAIPVYTLILLGAMILPVSALLVLRDIVKQWRLLKKDLNDNVVEQFLHERKHAFSDNDNTPPQDKEPIQNLELLPNSGIFFL